MKIFKDPIFLLLLAVVMITGAVFLIEASGILYKVQPSELDAASVVVIADLVEVKGGIPINIDYNYVFLVKYTLVDVIDGSPGMACGSFIWVGHKNPDANRFVIGKRYMLAIEPRLFELYDGGVINRYRDNPWAPYSPFLAIDIR